MPNNFRIGDRLKESSAVIGNLASQTELIERAAVALMEALRKGKKVVLFGNGGSAADAQHMAAEFVCAYANRKRKSLPALALTTDTSVLTAIGNDFGFEKIFSRQVESLVNDGDVVIALSTSGMSANVIEGAKAARSKGALVIGFAGETGGTLKAECDFCLCVSSKNTAYVQQAHITVGHILCALVEEATA